MSSLCRPVWGHIHAQEGAVSNCTGERQFLHSRPVVKCIEEDLLWFSYYNVQIYVEQN